MNSGTWPRHVAAATSCSKGRGRTPPATISSRAPWSACSPPCKHTDKCEEAAKCADYIDKNHSRVRYPGFRRRAPAWAPEWSSPAGTPWSDASSTRACTTGPSTVPTTFSPALLRAQRQCARTSGPQGRERLLSTGKSMVSCSCATKAQRGVKALPQTCCVRDGGPPSRRAGGSSKPPTAAAHKRRGD